METPNMTYRIVPRIIALLYILLFVYAATSKLIDFKHFRVQLGLSPYISNLADWIVWILPMVEYAIALLFLFPKYTIHALYASLFVMTAFTAYLFIVLNFSDNIPCSCGGILETLSWKAHLIFNILFMLLALIGILMAHKVSHQNQNTTT